MSKKYVVTTGDGHRIGEHYYTDWLVLAVWRLWRIKLDGQNRLVWKQLRVNV